MSNISENLAALMQDGRDIKAAIVAKGGTSIGAFDNFATEIAALPSGGGGGEVDRIGLASLGYTDEEIDLFQEVCFWSAADNEYYKVPQWNIDLAGIDLNTLKANNKDVFYIPKSCIAGKTAIGWREFWQFFALKLFVSFDITGSLGAQGFYECESLGGVNTPNATDIANALAGIDGLKNINAPKITSLATSALTGTQFLMLDLRNITTIGSYALNGCSRLYKLLLGNITNIPSRAFSGCMSMQILDLTMCTSVPTLTNVDAFLNTSNALQILVPLSLEEQWKQETNWVTLSDKIVGI